MRIRRNASKLLGSAYAAAYSNPPPATAGTAAAEPEEEFTVCELNRSPWDAMDINLCNFFTNPKEEDGGGILGNSYGTVVKEPISAIASTAAESAPTDMKEIESKKVNRKERKKVCKGKETLVAETERSVTYCKKSDGKGWHCKRLAQLPSSFCSYHLAQIRSYSSNHRQRAAATDASAAATGNGKNLHEKPAAVGETVVTCNFYYYYNGFGPWRSKRRGNGGVNGTCGNVMEEEGKEDMDSKESVNHDVVDNVVAGDGEYDIDCFDEDEDDDDDNFYSMPLENEENGKKKKGGETEKKKVLKKRGRKPFKCRSLKSLL